MISSPLSWSLGAAEWDNGVAGRHSGVGNKIRLNSECSNCVVLGSKRRFPLRLLPGHQAECLPILQIKLSKRLPVPRRNIHARVHFFTVRRHRIQTRHWPLNSKVALPRRLQNPAFDTFRLPCNC